MLNVFCKRGPIWLAIWVPGVSHPVFIWASSYKLAVVLWLPFFLPRAKEKPIILVQVKHDDLPNSYRIIPQYNTKNIFKNQMTINQYVSCVYNKQPFDDPVVLNLSCTLAPPGKFWYQWSFGSTSWPFNWTGVETICWVFVKAPVCSHNWEHWPTMKISNWRWRDVSSTSTL